MIGELALVVALPVAAAWAHELTHAVSAISLGGRVTDIDLLNLHVDFTFGEPAEVRTGMVFLAPAMVGLSIAPVLFLELLGRGFGITEYAIVLSWLVYTVNGGTHGELQLGRLLPGVPA